MNNWFNSLSPRERTIVFYGSIAVVIILIWLLIVKPLYNRQASLNQSISLQKTTLATMQQQSVEIKTLQKKSTAPKPTGNQNPQQLIERSLQTWRLKDVLERMQSQGNKGISIILKDANANRVMRFLHELESKHFLSITNMAIDNDNKKQGFADFRLTIQRSEK